MNRIILEGFRYHMFITSPRNRELFHVVTNSPAFYRSLGKAYLKQGFKIAIEDMKTGQKVEFEKAIAGSTAPQL